MTPPTVLDVFAARRRIAPRLETSPLRHSSWLSAAGGPVYLKLEAVQRTCSFKIRGALNALLRLVEEHPSEDTRRVVVTASAGNHGRAMAAAAEELGIRLVVFTPATAPRTKRDAIRSHGAELRDHAPAYDEAEREARAYAAASGGVYISPYNHPDIIAGAGTVAVEVIEACPSARTVLVPLGGGGLASGVGLAVRALAPRARVIGVEVEASTPFTTGLARGAITTVVAGPTLADGLAGNLEPDAITFPLVQQVVDQVMTVGEAELRAALRGMAVEEHLIVEGAAAAVVAALLSRRAPIAFPAVAIITGANIDADTLVEALIPDP